MSLFSKKDKQDDDFGVIDFSEDYTRQVENKDSLENFMMIDNSQVKRTNQNSESDIKSPLDRLKKRMLVSDSVKESTAPSNPPIRTSVAVQEKEVAKENQNFSVNKESNFNRQKQDSRDDLLDQLLAQKNGVQAKHRQEPFVSDEPIKKSSTPFEELEENEPPKKIKNSIFKKGFLNRQKTESKEDLLDQLLAHRNGVQDEYDQKPLINEEPFKKTGFAINDTESEQKNRNLNRETLNQAKASSNEDLFERLRAEERKAKAEAESAKSKFTTTAPVIKPDDAHKVAKAPMAESFTKEPKREPVKAKISADPEFESAKNKKIDDFFKKAHFDDDEPYISNREKAQTAVEAPKVKKEKTLLEKCMPYIVDDDGKKSKDYSAPSYTLESVADILKSDSEKTLEKISEKYDVRYDDLGKFDRLSKEAGNKQASDGSAAKSRPIKTISEIDTEDKQIFEEKMPLKKSVKNIQTNLSFFSDLDTTLLGADKKEEQDLDKTATIKFTPIRDMDGTADRLSVSSQTRSIDLTGEISQLPEQDEDKEDDETTLEQTEFEEYVPYEEANSPQGIKRLKRDFSLKKRSAFLKLVSTIFLTLVLVVFRLPMLSAVLLGNTKVCMIICTAVLTLIAAINYDIFKSYKKLLSRNSTADVLASTAVLFTLAYSVSGILKNAITLDVMILLAFILIIRTIASFMNASYMLSNIKQIATPMKKRAIKLIDDQASTFAMAKNSIEGDALIAAPQSTVIFDGYMKYSTFGNIMNGRLPFITILSFTLSLIAGFAGAAYFNSIVSGLYCAASIQCFAALPTIFFINNLPLFSAAKRLNRLGAVIAGNTGASRLEMANAVVFSASDIFPSGTVTLHHMKILAENTVDDTIIRAASLCDALGSPMAPIFKKIAGTGNITDFPDSDTVKYEDRMGISGWVGNKLLFIGNRTLMEAHGISVPSVEVDRKILRQGFFPVYVASEDTACALLVIQYTVKPEIAYQLRKITALGITVLLNNSDPNVSSEMICDYFGLYDDSVKVMTSAGCHMYKNAVTPVKMMTAPAMYKGNPLGFATLITCASKIKKSNKLLTVFYILASIIGALLFAYTSFDGSGTLISSTTVMLYGIISTIVSYIIYLIEKP